MDTEEVRVGCNIPGVMRIVFDIECTKEGFTMSDILRIAIVAFLDGRVVDFGRKDDLAEWGEAYRLLAEELVAAARQQGGEEE